MVIGPTVALTCMITVVKKAAAWNSDSYACTAQVIGAWRQPPCFYTFAGNAVLLLSGIIIYFPAFISCIGNSAQREFMKCITNSDGANSLKHTFHVTYI